jgi:sodium-dependent phosphate cotransporter
MANDLYTRVPDPHRLLDRIARSVAVVGLLFLFLLGVKGLGDGFKLAGGDLLDHFFTATGNPFFGFVIGLFATTLVQSSSVTTSMIVGLVAAPEHPLPLANAVPMVMGANIGTTVTNTIASLGHITRRGEFERAFAVATCHDFFNYFTVIVLLPFELATGYLQRTAGLMAGLLGGFGGVRYESPLRAALNTAMTPIKAAAEAIASTSGAQAAIVVLASATLIVAALGLLVRALRSLLQQRIEKGVVRLFGSNALLSMAIGAVVTVMVQSSSITTSLLVPLAGAGVLRLRQAFPVTIGANLGTTVTALLASMAVAGPNALAGVQIALVHLLFNLSGTVLIYPVPAIRRLPLWAAETLARVAARSKRVALLYVALLFYVLPGLLVFVEEALN